MTSFDRFKSYICAEVLADSLNYVQTLEGGVEVEVNDTPLIVKVSKKEN